MADDWAITGQMQKNTLAPAGGIQPVMEIHFRTRHGVTGSVEVPVHAYTPEHVRELIEQRVALIDAVHTL